MNHRFLFLLPAFFCLLNACEQKQQKKEKQPETIAQQTFEAGKTIQVTCDADRSISYTVYLPSGYTNTTSYPVIYLFDPHAKGSLPVGKYKTLADEFGLILAGSNSTKNGMDRTSAENTANTIMADTKQKLGIDEKKIMTCGFSGGARIASGLAATNKTIYGVISCSAGLPAAVSQLRKDLVFVGIAGKEDMNLTEIFDAGEALRKSELRHLVIYFDGPHEWPPVEAMRGAFEFCFKSASPRKTEEPAINSKIIEREKQQKKIYVEAFVKNDLAWWNSEFKALEQKISKKGGDEAERYMNIRLKNFLSLAAFSYANSSLSANKLQEADKYLSIYKLVDPQNAEHAYLRAKYYMLISKPDQAGQSLNEAATLGFNDAARLSSEPLFIVLHNTEGYRKIANQ